MSLENVDEDAIDTEALQAQIDLSMSFAQDLISSWMEPHKLPTSSRRNDLEKELMEYMKRPPRLGVGASIPEGHQSMSRETARLKGKLAGSKRPREEEDAVASKPVSDDEGESRAIAIKKKARPDPFGVHSKKTKRRKEMEVVSSRPMLPAVTLEHPKDGGPEQIKDEDESQLNGLAQVDFSPTKSKKKRKKTTHIQNGASSIAPSTPQGENTSTPPLQEDSPQHIVPAKPSTPQRNAENEAHGTKIDVSLTTTPSSSAIPRKTIPLDILKRPILNLTGPPTDHESDGDAAETPFTSPKKKRKRRKKKKNLATAEANTSTVENISAS